jgi:maleate cis-trans isomerase
MSTFPTTRHQFNMIHGDDTVCITTTAVTLPEVVQRFEDYLRACGFVIDSSRCLDLVDRETGVPVSKDKPDDLDPAEDGKEAV